MSFISTSLNPIAIKLEAEAVDTIRKTIRDAGYDGGTIFELRHYVDNLYEFAHGFMRSL